MSGKSGVNTSKEKRARGQTPLSIWIPAEALKALELEAERRGTSRRDTIIQLLLETAQR